MPKVSTKSPVVAPALQGVRVAFVEPASAAARLGIEVGDALIRLNSKPVEDVIDYWFQMAAERLKVEWRTPGGELKISTIRKAYHERLGVEVEPFEIKRCSNACVFCFVHQLPPGMRREL